MASATPAIEVMNLMADPRWPSFVDRLEHRKAQLLHRLATHEALDHPAMCRIAGEIRGLDYALGTPAVLADSDPRSE
jgi:hypothetical protein